MILNKDSLQEMLKEEQRMAQEREAQNGGQPSGKKASDKITIATFIIIPLLMIFMLIFGNSENGKGMGVCLFLMGAYVMVLPIIRRSVMLKRCTERIMAVCIYLDKRLNRSSKGGRYYTYAPQWEYTFNGRVYKHQEQGHSNIGVPKIGDEHEIFVNPDDPEEIYRKDIKGSLFQFFIGAIFAFVGVLAIMS